MTDIAYDRVLIVHGFGAGIDDHWFPWLASSVPYAERIVLPQSSTPDAARWAPLVAEAIGELTPGTVVVAHSLGCVTALQAVRRLATPARGHLGCFVAVAPFAQPLAPIGDPQLDAFIANGLEDFLRDANPSAIAPLVQRAAVVRSDDDPIVPPDTSDAFAAALSAQVHVVRGAGHFLGSDGYTQLPVLLDLLATS